MGTNKTTRSKTGFALKADGNPIRAALHARGVTLRILTDACRSRHSRVSAAIEHACIPSGMVPAVLQATGWTAERLEAECQAWRTVRAQAAQNYLAGLSAAEAK